MTNEPILTFLRQKAATATPGERVPSVRDLMKQFGRSQLLVQRALTRLKDEGVIRSEVGRGTFFAEPGAGTSSTAGFDGRSLLILRRSVNTTYSRLVVEKVSADLSAKGHRVLEVAYTDGDHALAVLRGLPQHDACIIQAAFETISLETLAAAQSKAGHVLLHGLGLTGTTIDCAGHEWGSSLAQALRLLDDRGHHRIGLAIGTFSNLTGVLVRKRFAEACAAKRLALDEMLIEIPQLPHQGYQEAVVQAIATRWQAGDQPFSALICWGVENGAWFREALAATGIAVPQDISVVLLGHPDMAQEHDDFFTIIGPTVHEQAESLSQLVDRRWQEPGGHPAIHLLEGECATRETSLLPLSP